MYLFSYVAGFLYGFVVVIAGGTVSTAVALIVGLLAYLAYFIFFESIWQRTPGKWITGTKVVRLDGSKPVFWRIVARTLCRFIPFEMLSFYGQYPWGWHDHISKTMVVPAKYTPAEIAAVNPRERGTIWWSVLLIIAPLVLIVVGGILASIVLVSLNSARNKGADAQVITNLNMARTQAEVLWTQENGYQGACDDAQLKSDLADAGQAGAGDPTRVACYADANRYIMVSPLKSGNYYCVDSKPETGTISGVDATSMTCDAMPGFVAD